MRCNENIYRVIRLRYHKPFPLFANSGTFCALALFIIYRNALPFYAFITYLLFKSRELYYAEALVMNVYMLGFMSVVIVPINALSFFLPNGIISLIEVIFLITYNTWTNLYFFKGRVVWWIIIRSRLAIVICYLLFNFASRLVMQWLM